MGEASAQRPGEQRGRPWGALQAKGTALQGEDRAGMLACACRPPGSSGKPQDS